MQARHADTYLGFAVGPNHGDSSKARCEVRTTGGALVKAPLGLQYDALAYNTFAAAVLSYIAQLEAPPK